MNEIDCRYKKKTILQASNLTKILLYGFCIVIVLVCLVAVLFWGDLHFIILVTALLIVISGVFVLELIWGMREVRNYNYLIRNGELVTGKIYFAYVFLRAKVGATYHEEESNKSYSYCTMDGGFFNDHRLQYYAKKYPEIKILVDKNDLTKGYILIREYYEEMNKIHGSEPYQRENILLK